MSWMDYLKDPAVIAFVTATPAAAAIDYFGLQGGRKDKSKVRSLLAGLGVGAGASAATSAIDSHIKEKANQEKKNAVESFRVPAEIAGAGGGAYGGWKLGGKVGELLGQSIGARADNRADNRAGARAAAAAYPQESVMKQVGGTAKSGAPVRGLIGTPANELIPAQNFPLVATGRESGASKGARIGRRAGKGLGALGMAFLGKQTGDMTIDWLKGMAGSTDVK